jgi:hypothetical protein
VADAVPTEDVSTEDEVVSPEDVVTSAISSLVLSHDDSDDSVGLDVVSVVDSVITDVVILEVEEVVSPKELVTSEICSFVTSTGDSD